MWTMFCERGRDLALDWRDVRADDATGSAHWEPRYTFSVTGRPVHNVIDSAFTFRDGRIVRARRHVRPVALEPHGARRRRRVLLGWTPFVQKAIRAQAQARSRRLDGTPSGCGTDAMTFHWSPWHGPRA